MSGIDLCLIDFRVYSSINISITAGMILTYSYQYMSANYIQKGYVELTIDGNFILPNYKCIVQFCEICF